MPRAEHSQIRAEPNEQHLVSRFSVDLRCNRNTILRLAQDTVGLGRRLLDGALFSARSCTTALVLSVRFICYTYGILRVQCICKENVIAAHIRLSKLILKHKM